MTDPIEAPRNAEEERRHLDHLTDGHWHDDCRFCMRRRVFGGTGLEGQ